MLVRRAQNGDVSAYEELVRIHQHRVLAVVGGILRGSEDVEDVAQQALAKAYFSIRRFDLRSAFGTWLYKIAVNECWDYLRKKKVRRLVYESDMSEEQVRKLESMPEHGYGGALHREDAGRRLEQRQLVERLLGRTRGKGPAHAGDEGSGRVFGGGNRGDPGTERQHGEGTAISGARPARGDVPEADAKASGSTGRAQAGKE